MSLVRNLLVATPRYSRPKYRYAFCGFLGISGLCRNAVSLLLVWPKCFSMKWRYPGWAFLSKWSSRKPFRRPL